MLLKKLVAALVAANLVALGLVGCAVKQRTAEGQMSQDIYTWPQKPIIPAEPKQ